MKHRDRFTNRVAPELVFPVGRIRVFPRLCQGSRGLISILQPFRLPLKTVLVASPGHTYSSRQPYLPNPRGYFNTHRTSCSGAV
jgi:hypothetical protein